jgi:nucleotidyltransferase substrate binding protein (TIGR01987 family)
MGDEKEIDIRWKQRFQNFRKALSQLRSAADLAQKRPLSDLERQGLIQSFEYTHELAWNVMRDYLKHQGATDITGSRDATRGAFQAGLLEDGDAWMEMIQSRNLSSHTYEESTAKTIAERVLNTYLVLFESFSKVMAGRLS